MDGQKKIDEAAILETDESRNLSEKLDLDSQDFCGKGVAYTFYENYIWKLNDIWQTDGKGTRGKTHKYMNGLRNRDKNTALIRGFGEWVRWRIMTVYRHDTW